MPWARAWVWEVAFGVGPNVGDRGDRDSGVGEVEGSAVGGVVGGEDDGA